MSGPPEPRADVPASDCSRAGCRAAARWRVEWRNPKIHAIDRRKVWVACDEHRDYLRDYLAAREFPVQVRPLDPADAGGPR
ncbi:MULTISPECIES: hypothetical protein [unclassified Microbacterium]|uniref:hypothetical protein n=1 Tax=unclassified Microbacterium TaxID=2609290 RepID=UPI00214CD75A|nr:MULTISPECIES: hypothetical protein [unclassified Microbacterium]MCR2809864.1 hypothetical protein [Microbacterium sp. zg.B185]WIM17827.1 hypothetical protein QNO12_09365 [Microbacterium sp. zg-B185]